MKCDQCELLVINGVVCHETGCPNAWRDTTRTCYACGCDFVPETRQQRGYPFGQGYCQACSTCCSDECVESIYN